MRVLLRSGLGLDRGVYHRRDLGRNDVLGGILRGLLYGFSDVDVAEAVRSYAVDGVHQLSEVHVAFFVGLRLVDGLDCSAAVYLDVAVLVGLYLVDGVHERPEVDVAEVVRRYIVD